LVHGKEKIFYIHKPAARRNLGKKTRGIYILFSSEINKDKTKNVWREISPLAHVQKKGHKIIVLDANGLIIDFRTVPEKLQYPTDQFCDLVSLSTPQMVKINKC